MATQFSHEIGRKNYEKIRGGKWPGDNCQRCQLFWGYYSASFWKKKQFLVLFFLGRAIEFNFAEIWIIFDLT